MGPGAAKTQNNSLYFLSWNPGPLVKVTKLCASNTTRGQLCCPHHPKPVSHESLYVHFYHLQRRLKVLQSWGSFMEPKPWGTSCSPRRLNAPRDMTAVQLQPSVSSCRWITMMHIKEAVNPAFWHHLLNVRKQQHTCDFAIEFSYNELLYGVCFMVTRDLDLMLQK